MAEQQTEKKKPSLFWRIVKWIGLGLLTILLIAALIFQAPWKVTTLFIVILLACTTLPKPYRKWFWLSAAAVVIALIIWVFLPDETKGWRPYTFEDELAALEAKYAIPDSENASVIYEQLFETTPSDANEPNFFSDSVHQFWTAQDHPETAQWLQEHKGTIDKLMQASNMDKCCFPINADIVSIRDTMDRLAPMRKLAYLLISAANNDIAEGRVDAALEKYLSLIKMTDHLQQQSTLIDLLVGMAIEGLVTKQFNRFVVTGDATEAHLSVIEKALAGIKHDWASDLPRILECEKLLAKNMICNLAYEINPNGQVRLGRDPTAAMRAEFPEESPPLTYWQRKLTKASALLGWFFLPASPQKAGKIIDDCYEGLYAMAEPNFDWQKEPEKSKGFSLTSAKFNFRFMVEILVSLMEPAYYRIHDTYLRLYADKRCSQIIIALRRYKNKYDRWPESLDDVKDLIPAEIFVDPINNDCFVYKLTEENFTLYSKGKNNIDEGGEYEFGRPEESELDDRLLWPKRTSTCDPNENTSDVE